AAGIDDENRSPGLGKDLDLLAYFRILACGVIRHDHDEHRRILQMPDHLVRDLLSRLAADAIDVDRIPLRQPRQERQRVFTGVEMRVRDEDVVAEESHRSSPTAARTSSSSISIRSRCVRCETMQTRITNVPFTIAGVSITRFLALMRARSSRLSSVLCRNARMVSSGSATISI